MKTETFRKVNLHSVTITLFFAGIILSGGSLYLVSQNLINDGLMLASVLIGATFLFGILSISLVARAAGRQVIYLEKTTVGTKAIESVSVSKIDQKKLEAVLASGQEWLTELCHQLEAAQAALYRKEGDFIELKYGYALIRNSGDPARYAVGEGIAGRVAAELTTLKIETLPEGYITVVSGLGQSSPRHLMVFPIRNENVCHGVVEIASFTPITEDTAREIEISIAAFAGNLIRN